MRNLIKIFAVPFLLGILPVPGFSASEKEQKLWYKANELADRLNGERWKFVVVKEEVSRLKQVVKDLRDIQLYPGNITKLNEDDSENIKDKLKGIEKKSNKAIDILLELEKPQEDAILISIEMLKESPNLDMIDILIKDNLFRIKDLVVVKKYVDTQWDLVHEVMADYQRILGLNAEKEEGGLIEDSFFKVLISQLGQASDVFYKKLHDYKDSITARTKRSSWEHMASVDLESIQKEIKNRKPTAIQRDLQRLAERYEGRLMIGGVYYYLGLSLYQDKKYQKALTAMEKVNSQSEYFMRSREYIIRCLFQMGKDDSVSVLFPKYISENIFKGPTLDRMKYINIQSLYSLEKDIELGNALLQFTEKNEIYFKAYMLYGKSLVRQKRDREASKVFKSIIKQAQLPLEFRLTAKVQLGYLKYEQEYYESAITDFKSLIDKKGFEPQALFGMVWCYVKMKDLETAEFTLKKLINQFPDSPLALDGLMVLSKWRFVKANKLWTYKLYTDRNKIKLAKYQKQIDLKIESGAINDILADEVKRKLAIVQLNLSSRVPVEVSSINDLFKEALELVSYIPQHYKSGEFSEVAYSGSRETALNKMKGLLTRSTLTSESRTFERNTKLDKKLYESQLLALDMHIQYLNWIDNYVDYLETQIKFLESEKKSKKANLYRGYLKEVIESISEICNSGLDFVDELIKNPLIESQRDKVIFYKGLLYFKLEQRKKHLSEFKNNYLAVQSASLKSQANINDKFYSNVEFEKIWNFFLQEYPESPYVPATIYYLGYSKYLQGDNNGIPTLQDFSNTHDTSSYHSHALAIVGDFFFETNDFAIAMDSYSRILNNPESPFFEKALYKLAWTYYQSEDYELALKTFTFILENLLNKEDSEKDTLFIEESLKMVAFSFAEMDISLDDNDDRVKAFVDNFSNPLLGATILHRTAYVFRKQGRLEKTKRVLNNLIENYEAYEDMPEAMMDLSVAYEIENNSDKALEIRQNIFDRYHKDTDWYKNLNNKFYKVKADSICEMALHKIAEHYFAKAKLANIKFGKLPPGSIANKDMFMKAIVAYEKFLDIYPNSKNSNKLYYRLAESYFALKKYYDASVLYLKAAQTNDLEIKTAASYNAIIAAEKYYELNK